MGHAGVDATLSMPEMMTLVSNLVRAKVFMALVDMMDRHEPLSNKALATKVFPVGQPGWSLPSYSSAGEPWLESPHWQCLGQAVQLVCYLHHGRECCVHLCRPYICSLTYSLL